LNDNLFDVEVEQAPYAEEYDDWEEEVRRLKKLKIRTEDQRRDNGNLKIS